MGTSASSRGPGSGPDIPIVPPWVEDDAGLPPRQPEQPPVEMAPAGRWRGVRTSLGKFGGDESGGRRRHLERGLGHYSRTGMGGSGVAARRMAGTARTAGSLYQALDALANGQPLPAEFGLQPGALDGRSPGEIVDILVDAIRPIDGTQDTEAARDSAARALAEVVADGADLLNLNPQQIDQVLSAMVANDVALRIELDVGKAVIDKAPSKAAGLDRLQEMKDYVREVVEVQYAAERARAERVDRAAMERMTREAIRQTFEVFELNGGIE